MALHLDHASSRSRTPRHCRKPSREASKQVSWIAMAINQMETTTELGSSGYLVEDALLCDSSSSSRTHYFGNTADVAASGIGVTRSRMSDTAPGAWIAASFEAVVFKEAAQAEDRPQTRS